MDYYIKNMRKEIIKIIADRGQEVGCYEYDPYGNILEYNDKIAKINNITGLILYAYCNYMVLV